MTLAANVFTLMGTEKNEQLVLLQFCSHLHKSVQRSGSGNGQKGQQQPPTLTAEKGAGDPALNKVLHRQDNANGNNEQR